MKEEKTSGAPSSKRNLYEAWADATADVRRLETELASRWAQVPHGSDAPPVAMRQELVRLRAVADEKLTAFIEQQRSRS